MPGEAVEREWVELDPENDFGFACILRHATYHNFRESGAVTGRVRSDVLRSADGGNTDRIGRAPLRAYLHPGRFARISESRAFPFPADFSR